MQVRLLLWKRDGRKCVICGASDKLYFDHDLPWSKGGISATEENVQLLMDSICMVLSLCIMIADFIFLFNVDNHGQIQFTRRDRKNSFVL